MANKLLYYLLFMLLSTQLYAQEVINLNGQWEFEQTTQAFPPARFTRKIPVPGLVSLATPKIDQYDIFFRRPEKSIYKTNQDLLMLDYTPKYNWYKKTVQLPNYPGKEAVLVIKKSQYVTQVFVNGIDVGVSVSCATPIILPLTNAIRYGQPNEILIKTGDKAWYPSQAAGGVDKEKEHYLPGIWDDVYITFSEKFSIQKALFLPSLKHQAVTAKLQLRSFYPLKTTYGQPKQDKAFISITLYEKNSRKPAATYTDSVLLHRDNLTTIQYNIPLPKPHAWSPEDPFLYTAEVKVYDKTAISDQRTVNFGMRDFERMGKHFYLNGQLTYLRGSNITLHRFFEDPDSHDLAWNREWVKQLFIDYAKKLHWNAYRICVGLVPDFWYDLADEYGIMLQNEWMYWEDHGWDEQIRAEYTDWVWSDGNHPSIVIWDAINENKNDYIGNTLIPELKRLDPTRVWDAGYMAGGDMQQDEMDEPHPYMSYELRWWDGKKEPKNYYELGNLEFEAPMITEAVNASQAQLVNEYGWVWTWRDGQPSKLTKNLFRYYVGNDTDTAAIRAFQAYWLQLDTEWLRSHRALAGVLAFTHLTNNYGYTGDWFSDITRLTPTPTLQWFKHAFAPAAVFIDLMDQRYVKQAQPHAPGEQLAFNLVGINDYQEAARGSVEIKLYDQQGKITVQQTKPVTIPALGKSYLPVVMTLPAQEGGYTLVVSFTGDKQEPVISRRYLKIGKPAAYAFYEPDPGTLR